MASARPLWSIGARDVASAATEYHMWVQTQLIGGVDKSYYDALGDDPFRS